MSVLIKAYFTSIKERQICQVLTAALHERRAEWREFARICVSEDEYCGLSVEKYN